MGTQGVPRTFGKPPGPSRGPNPGVPRGHAQKGDTIFFCGIKHRGGRVLIFTISGSNMSKCIIILQKFGGPSTSQGGKKLQVHPIDLKMVAK